jgi:hypothetical protein
MTAIAHVHGMPIFEAPKEFHLYLPDYTVTLVRSSPRIPGGTLANIKAKLQFSSERKTPEGSAKHHDAEFAWLAENVKERATIFWQPVTMGPYSYPMYIVFQQQKDCAAFMLATDHQADYQ